MNKSMDVQRSTGEPFYRKHRNLFVGLFILVPIIVLPVFLMITFLRSDMLAKWEYLYVKYETAGGLARNGAVTILGMKVGYIQEISLRDAGYIEVKMKIKSRHMPLIRKNSKARLQQKNVAIGDWEIDVTQGRLGSLPAENGDTLESEVQAPLAKTLDQVTKTVETLQKILQNILEGKGTVGRLIKEDTLVTIAQGAARNANSVIVHANKTLGRVDTVLIRLAQIGDKGKVLADSAVGIAAKVGRLISDVNLLVNSIQTASQDLPGLMNRVQADISEVELMIKALQNNFLIKGGINSQPDPMLNDNPSK